VAREFWEAIAKADPGYHPTEEPFTVPDYVEIREEGGSKPNPGFTGVWGTGGSIDCFRPR
jgi:hypothetical protein